MKQAYEADNKAGNHHGYRKVAPSSPLENTTDVNGSGSYIIKEKGKSDSLRVTYCKYYSYCYLLQNPMSEWKEDNSVGESVNGNAFQIDSKRLLPNLASKKKIEKIPKITNIGPSSLMLVKTSTKLWICKRMI